MINAKIKNVLCNLIFPLPKCFDESFNHEAQGLGSLSSPSIAIRQ